LTQAHAPRPSGRILIVDDDELFLRNYQATLSAEGYAVEVARTREEALARLDDDDDWDVVLLDQKLLGPRGPDLGIELIQDVHGRAPGAKAIVVTAFASADRLAFSILLGPAGIDDDGLVRFGLSAGIFHGAGPLGVDDAWDGTDGRAQVFTVQSSALVPEPGTGLLAAVGLFLLGARRRRHRVGRLRR